MVMLLFLEYFQDNEEVVLWMNTVGPYHNRQETYGYFSLPFCAGPKESISHYHETLGEALQGTELEFSGLQIEFKAEWSTLIGPDPSRHCDLIGWDHIIDATPALLCHKEPAQGTQSPLLGALIAFRWIVMA